MNYNGMTQMHSHAWNGAWLLTFRLTMVFMLSSMLCDRIVVEVQCPTSMLYSNET